MSLDAVAKSARKEREESSGRSRTRGKGRGDARGKGKKRDRSPSGLVIRANKRNARPEDIRVSARNPVHSLSSKRSYESRPAPPTNRVKVNGLATDLNSDDVTDVFSEFEGFRKAFIDYDRSGVSKGSAVVVCTTSAKASTFIEQYNGVKLDGDIISCSLMTTPRITPREDRARHTDRPRQARDTRDVRAPRSKGDKSLRVDRDKKPATKREPRHKREPKKVYTQEELDAELDAFNAQE